MTTIGRHLAIAGEVSCDDDLVIEGCVEGAVVAVRDGAVTVATGARVRADLRARSVIVDGAVHGSIVASERITLGPSAVVEGSLSAGQIVIAEGATINGSLDMGRRTIAARVAVYRAARPVAP